MTRLPCAHVVFPWSTCARMQMLRMFDGRCWRVRSASRGTRRAIGHEHTEWGGREEGLSPQL